MAQTPELTALREISEEARPRGPGAQPVSRTHAIDAAIVKVDAARVAS